ncbi:MAG: Kelch repeat-containing protein [Acidimicrobiales bacterium]
MRRSAVGAAAFAVALLAGGCSSDGDDPAAPNSSAAGVTSTVAAGQAAAVPEARTEVAGATWDGDVVVAGGLTADGRANRRVDAYLPAANRWTARPQLPQGLHHLGMAVLGERLYVAGGYTDGPGGEWQAVASVHSLGLGESSWRQEPSMTRPRGAHGLAAVGGRLVVAGGVTGGLTDTTESWAPGEASWRVGPPLAQAREHLAMAAVAGRVYVIGGRLGGFDSNLRSVESWDGREAAWRAEAQLNDTRGGTSAAEVAGKICVAGGEATNGTIATIECFAPGQGRWARAPSLGSPRHGLAVAGLGTKLHVIAGGPQPGLFVSTTHEVIETA